MGVARLSKVTVISPRSDYPEVAKALAKFKDFHPAEHASPNFDPRVQDLTVRAVRLFSQADQATKDLGLKSSPGWMDQVFKGVKVEKTSFDAGQWDELLTRVERELDPIVQEVRNQKAALQKATKDMADSQAIKDALSAVSGFSADLAGVSDLHRFRVALCIVKKTIGAELRSTLPDAMMVSQSLSQTDDIVLVAVKAEDGTKLDRAIKGLDIKPLTIPQNFPQNPSEAYKRLSQDYDLAKAKKEEMEASLAKLGASSGSRLLAMRELSESAREMLDEARVSGDMKRMATITGYVPEKKEGQFREQFSRWMVYSTEVHEGEEGAPVLFDNGRGVRLWQLVTAEQGIPGGEEVDPTPLISFVFPIFFGLMFGDFGHGLLFTLFVLFVRQRTTGVKRQWANIFLITGISSTFFGAVFGEFFGFSLYSVIPIPAVIEIIQRPLGQAPSPNIANIETVMVIAILIGVAHLITGLTLNVYEKAKAGERLELVTEDIPALTMYISGLGYGIAFIGAGFKFDVLATSASAPLVGIPINELGTISIAVLVPSMLVIFLGQALAVRTGRIKGTSFAGALSNGGLEVFEKILQYLSNTISYIRLAVMLLVHAVLLVIVAPALTFMFPVFVPVWIVFNLLILALEALIVYVQDLRLHVYEFFTKFYAGTGRPFKSILPERQRISIKWS
ncbi:MAG TPA: V-type ATPase 116kDa subunit family protein [Nitrososphaerales archaeon]|nr:V-type ATPase 116kDa subunit family protein [Nitrososphaerales archaeon]